MEPSLGQQLKKARMAMGLSYADVEHATRVSQIRLQQLEEDNWTAFGSMTYARSFARTYGHYLGVDVEPALTILPQPILGGARDYRHLTTSFGPWVKPLRQRVLVHINHSVARVERRRWQAVMLVLFMAAMWVILGRSWSSASKSEPEEQKVPGAVPVVSASPPAHLTDSRAIGTNPLVEPTPER
jgi:cytoskeletal protein RodZ